MSTDILFPMLYYKLDSIVNGLIYESNGVPLTGSDQVSGNDTALMVRDSTFGACIQFNGSNSLIQFPGNNSGSSFAFPGNLSGDAFTVSLWAFPQAYQNTTDPNGIGNILLNVLLNNQSTLTLGISAGGMLQVFLQLTGGTKVTYTSTLQVSAGNWHFISLVFAGTAGATLQVDSQLQSVPDSAGTLNLQYGAQGQIPTFQMFAGAEADYSVYYQGNEAHIRLYTTALTTEEIAEVIKADLAGSLLYYLPLAESSSTTTPNYSLYTDYTASPEGQPIIVSDTRFGSVMTFNGSSQYVALQGLACSNTAPWAAVTLEFWIKTTNTSKAGIISFDPDCFWEVGIEPSGTGAAVYWTAVNTNRQSLTLNGTVNVADGQWHFISVSYLAGTGLMYIYTDGKPDVIAPNSEIPLPLGGQRLGTSAMNTTRYGYIGISASGSTPGTAPAVNTWFQGSLCQMRMYASSLTAADIERDMGSSLTSSFSYWLGYPILFSVMEENQYNVIYIYDEPEGHDLTLELLNTTASSGIVFPAQTTANAANYQIVSYFRPGTLSAKSLPGLTLQNPRWNMSQPVPQDDGSVALFFTSKTDYTLFPMQRLALTLSGVSAEPAGGSRSTRIQFAYNRISFLGTGVPLIGQTQVSVNIVAHAGERDIPLFAGFISGGTVFNGSGNSNTLGVRVMNVRSGSAPGGGGITFSGASSDSPTRLYISMQGADSIQGNDPGPLNTWSNLATVIVSVPFGGTSTAVWNVTAEKQGTEPYWVLTPADDFILPPGASIEISLGNVVASQNAGCSNLYLEYENISGYWDGRFILVITKSNVAVSGKNLGIGTGNPPAPLTVMGGSEPVKNSPNTGFLIIGDGNGQHLALGTQTLSVQSSGTATGPLSLHTSHLSVFGKTTFLQGPVSIQTTSNNQITFSTGSSGFGGLINFDTGGNLFLGTGSFNDYGSLGALPARLSINNSGNIGMGTLPASKIAVSIFGTVPVSTTANEGILLVGNTAAAHLLFDGSNILSKTGSNSPNGGNLGITAGNLWLTGKTSITLDAPTISFKGNPNFMGIPLMTTTLVSFSLSNSDSKKSSNGKKVSQTKTVNLFGTVVNCMAVLQSFSLGYTDSDHHVRAEQVTISPCTVGSPFSQNGQMQTPVTVTVTILLTDDHNKYGYQGTADIVLLANVSTWYS